MTVVRSADDLTLGFGCPSGEAVRALGDGTECPLRKRDCSAQRRSHTLVTQKPAAALPVDLVIRLRQAAVDRASALNYVDATTAEFLRAIDRFPRGLRLPSAKSDVVITRNSGGCRVHEKNCHSDVLPAPGTSMTWSTSQSAGIWIDGDAHRGAQNPPLDDVLTAKISALVSDWRRRQAVDVMTRAPSRNSARPHRNTERSARDRKRRGREKSADYDKLITTKGLEESVPFARTAPSTVTEFASMTN